MMNMKPSSYRVSSKFISIKKKCSRNNMQEDLVENLFYSIFGSIKILFLFLVYSHADGDITGL